MTPDRRLLDDAVLRRVADARPAVPEEDLSPTSERAIAIADRIVRAHPAADRPRPRRRVRDRRLRVAFGTLGLTAALAAVVLLVTGVFSGAPREREVARERGVPAAEAIHLSPPKHAIPHSTLVEMDRTPLGRAIAAGLDSIQQNLDTGTPAQNRKAIAALTRNQIASELAAAAVARVHAEPKQRVAQRNWVRGARLQATADGEEIASLHAYARGDTALGKRLENLAGIAFNNDDGLTGWSENALTGNPGPLPRFER